MNKTLLLILCDFLLLNLLALTRWEKAEPPRPKRPPVPELAANAVTKEQDLVETMRQSLSDEKAVRDELAQKLSAADLALAAREQSLAQAQAERQARGGAQCGGRAVDRGPACRHRAVAKSRRRDQRPA